MALGEKLKFFVVGEKSGNPGDWLNWHRAFVAAHSPEEAITLANMGEGEYAAEISPDEPQVLFFDEDIGPEE